MDPKFSFIILVYNAGNYLEQCLNSVVNQSLRNIEIICVDDGSIDNSYKILKKYQKKDKRIKIYTQNNLSQNFARNEALKNAKGEYIVFVDAHDWIDLNSAKELYGIIKENDLDILIVNPINYDEDNETFFATENNTNLFPTYFDGKIFSYYEIKDYIFKMSYSLYSKVYNRLFLERNNILFSEGLFFGEYPFHCEVMLCSKKIKIFRKHFYYQRYPENSWNSCFNKKYFDTIEISNIVNNIFKEYNFYKENKKVIINQKITYLIDCYNKIDNKHKNEYISLLCEDFKKIKENNYEFKEYLENLQGLNKYFFTILNDKLNYHKLNLLLYEYEFNGKEDEIPQINDINVAVILDSLSYNSYNSEFNAFILEPHNWLNIFEENEIDLFFCESAWDGVSESAIFDGIAVEDISSPWRNKIINSNNDKEHTLDQIVDYCKKHDIPTIFWNKEDPYSFDEFVDSALKFDYIFTTDYDSIVEYNVRNHENVFLLLFATQIKLFNPISIGKRSNDIIFAGSWYPSLSNRCLIMEDLFTKILNSGHDLKIYNRHSKLALTDTFWRFPKKYESYVNPSVSVDKMVGVYKESKYSLNINSITDSKTMFARRVFELMSSNTFVISNYSKGLYNLFGDNVLYLDQTDSLVLNDYDIEKICEENLYNILENHTYYNRFKYVLDTIQFKYYEKKPVINIFYSLNQFKLFDIISDFNSVNVPLKKCIIITEIEIENHFENDNIILISKKKLYNYIKNFSNNEFILFRDINEKLSNDFIRKAILHYKYINMNIPIVENDEKYVFHKTSEFKNILINSKMYKVVLENLFEKKCHELKVYTI